MFGFFFSTYELLARTQVIDNHAIVVWQCLLGMESLTESFVEMVDLRVQHIIDLEDPNSRSMRNAWIVRIVFGAMPLKMPLLVDHISWIYGVYPMYSAQMFEFTCSRNTANTFIVAIAASFNFDIDKSDRPTFHHQHLHRHHPHRNHNATNNCLKRNRHNQLFLPQYKIWMFLKIFFF